MGAGPSVPSKRKLQSIIFLKLYNNDRSVTVKQRLYQAFDETDSSGDGVISSEEFAAVVTKLGVEVGGPKCSQIFDVFDTDHSGTISRTEFLTFMGYEDPTQDGGDKHDGVGNLKHDREVQRMVREQQIDDSTLRLEVYRQLAGKGMVFVGQAGYEGGRLRDFPENVSTKVEQTLREKPDDADQQLVGGDLQFRITRMSLLTIKIERAQGLAKADMLGKSDPFVVVKMNNEVRHRTAVIKKCLDPVWENESLTIALPTHPKKLGKCVLQVEVFDKDTVGGNDFLGRVTLQGGEILEQATGEPHARPLVGDNGVQTKQQKGEVIFSLQHARQMRVVVAEVRKLTDPQSSETSNDADQKGAWDDAVGQANSLISSSKVSCKVMWKGALIGETGEVECKGRSAEWAPKSATFLFPCEDST